MSTMAPPPAAAKARQAHRSPPHDVVNQQVRALPGPESRADEDVVVAVDEAELSRGDIAQDGPDHASHDQSPGSGRLSRTSKT